MSRLSACACRARNSVRDRSCALCLCRQPQADTLQFSPQVQQALDRYQSKKAGRSAGAGRSLSNHAEGQRERRSHSPAKQHLIVSVMTGQVWHMVAWLG